MRTANDTHSRAKRGLVVGIAIIIAVFLTSIVVTQVRLDTVAGQAGATEKDIKALRKIAENNNKNDTSNRR